MAVEGGHFKGDPQLLLLGCRRTSGGCRVPAWCVEGGHWGWEGNQ